MPTTAAAPREVPPTVRIVQLVCLLQAVALVVVAVVLVADLVAGTAVVRPTVVMLVVVYALVAALLVVAARQVGRGRGAVTAALLTWFLLAGFSVVTIGLEPWIAVVAAASCLVGAVALMWPSTRRFLRRR